ncbi:MAG: hypothetical protein IJ449_12235 [Clostridia bacterium]|nr:hypothetical protein [Clostridia bacterium]
MKNKNNKKRFSWKACSPAKKLLLLLCAVFLVLIVWIAGTVAYEIAVNGEYYAYRYSGTEQSFAPLDITFAPQDFEENIFENSGYMAKDRDICYISGSQSNEVALDEDGSFYGAGLVFFQNYFNCLVNGDHTHYADFFTEDYASDSANLPLPTSPFTMQKIYNISVDFRSSDTVIVSENEKKQYYVVKYAIYQNNGSFRSDIEPDTVVPLLFEVTVTGEEMHISKIIKYIG